MRIYLKPTPYQISIMLSFLLPAVILNPVICLHGVNAILSRVLPPIAVPNATTKSAPYYPLGPSAENPHLDIHASDTLCWSYTALMVVLQLAAFQVFKMPSEEESEDVRDDTESNSDSKQPIQSPVKSSPKSEPRATISFWLGAL